VSYTEDDIEQLGSLERFTFVGGTQLCLFEGHWILKWPSMKPADGYQLTLFPSDYHHGARGIDSYILEYLDNISKLLQKLSIIKSTHGLW